MLITRLGHFSYCISGVSFLSVVMARIFAPRILVQQDKKPTLTDSLAPALESWYKNYSLLYEQSLLERWTSGYILPWPQSSLISGLGGLDSRLSGLDSRIALHRGLGGLSRIGGLGPGFQNRYSALQRVEQNNRNLSSKWVC